MNMIRSKRFIYLATGLLLLAIVLGGCSGNNLNPIDPQKPTVPSNPGKPAELSDVVITYNYGESDKVQLSANNITLKVGQRLILQPAKGLTKNTRFSSSGGPNFFGDYLQQQEQQPSGKIAFIAKSPGKGKLQVIPNTSESNRATDLWVTVQ
jgi:hypothetical protein